VDLALSVTLGLLFLVTAFASVFLMFHLWGYPFDKATRTSAAPPALMRLHRVLGWVYLILYLVMMSEMLPRLWQYQVELPPRTVVHVLLGFLIGLVLLLKISIIRFFRHLEEWMPVLGVILLACTVLLSGLSVPFALREFSLARSAVGGGVYSEENRDRVARLLPQAEMPEEAPLAELATKGSLRAGRDVLAGKCVVCHDLKTILVQPRTPSGWWKTVERMAIKPSFSAPMTDDELYVVTAYLIAISGDLQRSVKERRKGEDQKRAAVADVKDEAKSAALEGQAGALPAFDEAAALKTYDTLCAQCHDLADVEAKPPRTAEEVKNLILRMIAENGMEAPKEDLDLVYLHMVKRFAGGQAS
jgi:mono/diheme cytochrome c family protein